ncbi:MAG: glycosyl hydrolase, partial [Verrucomicrobiota bacterium]
EHFRTAPSQMKPEVDQLFLTGINHIFYHGTAYSPADAPWPGWLFYASMQANSRNPLWSEFAGINGYIARCQSMLQAGAPDNDVLLYWPVEDLWHSEKGIHRRLSAHAHDWLTPTPAGKAADELVNRGYAFDFISDRQLQQTKLENGALKTPGAAYRTVLVPRTEHMPVATLQRLMDLAEQGATVLFLDALPNDVPGFGSLSARREQFKVQLERVRLGTADAVGVRSAKIGRGRVCLAGSLPKLLETAQVSREQIADLGVGVIRRRLSDGYGYFMANLSGKNIEGWVKLGRPAESVLMLDPMTKRTGVAASRRSGEAVEVFVQLRSGESIILQTRDSGQAQADTWRYFAEEKPATMLTGEWHLNFIRGGPELPAARNLTKLGSWTEASDAAAQNFGGTARYEIQFTVPANIRPDAWRLDLGDVRETARISINGQPVGNVWSLPCDTVVTSPLKPGTNVLALEVTSTAANRIRDLDKRGVPWKNGKNFVTIGYEPFDASTWSLHPTGLLGPVRLIPLSRFQPQLQK